jgi:hypothetical protein
LPGVKVMRHNANATAATHKATYDVVSFTAGILRARLNLPVAFFATEFSLEAV